MTISGTVIFERAFISLASNPSQFFSCGTSGTVGGGGARTDTTTQDGSFRNYANYNTRLILGTSRNEVLVLVLRALTPAQVALAQSFIGQMVLFRDTYGRKLWGSYIMMANTDIPLSGTANVDLATDVSITFQVLTFAEGV